MTLPIKAGLGVLAAGSVAGLGYAGNAYFMNKEETTPKTGESGNTVQQVTAIDKLIKEQFEYILLNTKEQTDDSHWRENWSNYQKNNTNKEKGQDALKLDNWVKGGSEDLTEDLKKKCEALSTSTIKDRNDDLYKNATQYCSRKVTIADEAKKDGLSVIKTEDNSADQTTWKSKIDKKQTLQPHFDKLSIVGDSLTAEVMKQKCKEATTKKKEGSDYQAFYEAYKNVCTKLEGEN